MPIYEYSCQACGKKFELLRAFSQADNQTTCQSCGSTQTKRLVSVATAFSGGSSLTGGSSCSSCASSDCSSCGSY
ncbi:MAG: zinc ribbon domain-containing protein [Chloroflexi bacterium]|nr:zinc ribbon domain-containing protein [Chloroflexota bacterium]